MTTERQIAANRQNAQKSTGPRTPDGKAISSRNNTRHGRHASTPVIPRLESETAWEYHRVTCVQGLAPANAIEEALAERIALILWRLGRVARYEQSITTQAQYQATDDVAAEYEDADVQQIRARFAHARRCLRAFDRFRQLRADAPMTGYDADAIVTSVARQIEGFDLIPFSVPGLIGADDRIADLPGWTVARIRQFVDAIAQATSRDADELIHAAATSALRRCNQARTPYRHLNRRLDDLRQERILPQTTALDNVVRYENHLNRQLNQTLTQLRQLQRHRETSSRLRPAYNDYHVDVEPDREVVSTDSNPIPSRHDVYSTAEYTP